jgi:hypothetical protein
MPVNNLGSFQEKPKGRLLKSYRLLIARDRCFHLHRKCGRSELSAAQQLRSTTRPEVVHRFTMCVFAHSPQSQKSLLGKDLIANAPSSGENGLRSAQSAPNVRKNRLFAREAGINLKPRGLIPRDHSHSLLRVRQSVVAHTECSRISSSTASPAPAMKELQDK